MGYRKIDCEIWDDPWFERLTASAKLLFIYLWSNKACNQAGCYRISARRIKFECGIDIADHAEALKGKVVWDPKEEIVWVVNFFKRQSQNAKFGVAAVNCISGMPDGIKAAWYAKNHKILVSYGLLPVGYQPDTISISYLSEAVTEAVSETEAETGTEQKTTTSPDGDCPSVKIHTAPPPNCPHTEIIALYHEILPMLPKIRLWGDDSKAILATRWKEDESRQSLDWWRGFFEHVSQSDFLCGRASEWRADLRWLVGPRNWEKIANGRYHGKSDRTAMEEKFGKAGAKSHDNLQGWLTREQEKDNARQGGVCATDAGPGGDVREGGV